MNLAEARTAAEEVMRILAPACMRIEVAGSIRREKAEVKDIEVVAVPIWDTDLIGGRLDSSAHLSQTIHRAVESGQIAWDEENKKNGPRYKRLRVAGIGVDLFLCRPENWGPIYTIRTGSWEFSKFMMTPRSKRGAMPDHLAQIKGFLWEYRSDSAAERARALEVPLDGVQIACMEEADYFDRVGLPMIRPRERVAARINEFRGLNRGRPIWHPCSVRR